MTPGRLKKIQADLGYSNRELADLLFISVSLLEKYRSGRRRIQEKIATMLEIVYQDRKLLT